MIDKGFNFWMNVLPDVRERERERERERGVCDLIQKVAKNL